MRGGLTPRIVFACITLSALLGGMFAVLVVGIAELREAGLRADRSIQILAEAQHLERLTLDLETGQRGFVITGNRAFLQPWLDAQREIPRTAAALRKLIGDDRQTQLQLRSIESGIDDYLSAWSRPVVTAAERDLASARALVATGGGKRRVDRIRERFDALVSRQQRRVSAFRQRAEQKSDEAKRLGIAGGSASLGLVVLFALYLSRSVVRPVRRVARASAALGEGDLAARVPENETAELGVLARSFNSMADSLAAGLEAQEQSRQELERQNVELRRLDVMKDDFIAVVSHELRTPLTSIRGYLELVLEGEGGELTTEQQDLLEVVERNTERLLLLVNDLLLVAQAEAGKLVVETAEVDLGELVAYAAEAARPRADAAAVDLRAHVPEPLAVEGDRIRIGQLLDNLLSNALKFTPAGGRVSLTAAADGAEARLEVRDTGVGISAEDQARLFSRFFRTAQAMREAVPGTGLGLAISQAIAEGHGGSIEVESELGRGTTFRVRLPLAGTAISEVAVPAEVAR